jgi:hypothetical protein
MDVPLMSLSLRIIYFTLTGALGALAAWFILDVGLQIQIDDPYLDSALNGALVGLAVGIAINGFAGLIEFKLWAVVRGILIGLTAGLIGGALGLLIGELLYQHFGQSELLRILGWAIFGLFLGLADGLLARSSRRILYAGIGGLLGGLMGGVVSSLLWRFTDLPNTSRALGYALLGALVGLFIGLLPTVLRNALSYASLKVISSGRNEGKERLIDKKRILIGSEARCDLPLYGDPEIIRQHAVIEQLGDQFILRPLGDAIVVMNDRGSKLPTRITQSVLQKEDQFQIGGETLIFRKKSSEAHFITPKEGSKK